MQNPYKVLPAKIIKKEKQNEITYLFRLRLPSNIQQKFDFLPGQFMQAGLMGFREAPISICSSPKYSRKFFELTIRGVGRITQKLVSLNVGDEILVRGPYGNGFPDARDKNLILIGGGCGFVPLRSVIEAHIDDKKKRMQIFIGCKDKDSLFFKDKFKVWKKSADFRLILEKGSLTGFGVRSGFITDLLDQPLLDQSMVFVVGPRIMYQFVIRKLLKAKIKPENIFLSLEKRMYCGQGLCQHCAVGSKYICKDGPVFSLTDLAGVPEFAALF
ncbi:MAG: FAD/NAD(P)-binding protein [Patescibacteria group bacterium]